MPTTSLARTIVDLGDHRPAADVRRAFVAAEQARLIDMPAVDDVVGRVAFCRGAAVLRELLRAYDPRWHETRSELELLMLDALAGSGLPEPLVNHWVAGRFMVDFLWPQQRLAVETDGGRVHGTPTARRDDARRDHTLRRLGYRVLRVPYAELRHAPEHVALKLTAELGRRPGARAGRLAT